MPVRSMGLGSSHGEGKSSPSLSFRTVVLFGRRVGLETLLRCTPWAPNVQGFRSLSPLEVS